MTVWPRKGENKNKNDDVLLVILLRNSPDKKIQVFFFFRLIDNRQHSLFVNNVT